MADIYATTIESTTVGANTRKLLGDGAAGVGPYTSFGTPKLQALKIISATKNFTTTPTATNIDLAKDVFALQSLAEIYYVGVPTATGANQFVALVNLNKTDSGDGYANANELGTSYENLEDAIGAALGVAEYEITITNSTLTGLTFS